MITFLLLGALLFDNITARAGIRWRHVNGESPDRFLVETTTGGIGFLDFDNDGKMDLFLVTGGETRRGKAPVPARHALYRNLGGNRFLDVTTAAGILPPNSYGMGVTACDFDNDGHTDLFLTGYPRSTLYRNLGNGKFLDLTATAGVANHPLWAASAACLDFDNDGKLDLFVANYAEFSFDHPKPCEFSGEPAYCAQTEFPGLPPRLYRNLGNWKFADVTAAARLHSLAGRALGAVAVDVNQDANIDLFVARDASPNLLLINQGDGTFLDFALEAEVAYNPDGVARAGMGVDAGDVDGDGRVDFLVTNFDSEYHALYLSRARFPFFEATVSSGLAMHSRPYVGWGVRLADFDRDGDLDAIIANGHLHAHIEKSNRSVRYREPPLLLVNDGKGNFRNASPTAGEPFSRGYLGRGLATADIDNDGALDIAFIDLNAPPVLLHNRTPGGNWLGLRLVGSVSNRDAIGAKVTLGSQVRWVTGGGSFLSSSDPRLLFGIGNASQAPPLEILWPSGRRQRLPPLTPNRYHTITEPNP
jgi:hypothetical protein